MATPFIAKELQASCRSAIADAKARRHELMTLEHLLLALTDDLETRKTLVACGTDLKRLRDGLESFLASQESLPHGANVQPQQTIGIERVLQRAAIHALNGDRKGIDGGDVLVAMFREDESHALLVLEEEGLTRVGLLNHLGRSTSAGFAPDVREALEHYRDERALQLGRDVSMGEALDEILRKALGLPPPNRPEST